ncbi:hypothetical protein PUATCC27989T_05676 [Phytobacter ursingii]|nr:hypothetical protein PUATCC27989T_05676 [Phytobacter ursingii]
MPPSSSFASAIFTPVKSRNAPKTYSSHSNWEISQLPAKIMMVLFFNDTATTEIYTRRCSAAGTEK